MAIVWRFRFNYTKHSKPQIHHQYLLVLPLLIWFDLDRYWATFTALSSIESNGQEKEMIFSIWYLNIVQLELKMGVKIDHKIFISLANRATLISVWASSTSSSSSHKYVLCIYAWRIRVCLYLFGSIMSLVTS